MAMDGLMEALRGLQSARARRGSPAVLTPPAPGPVQPVLSDVDGYLVCEVSDCGVCHNERYVSVDDEHGIGHSKRCGCWAVASRAEALTYARIPADLRDAKLETFQLERPGDPPMVVRSDGVVLQADKAGRPVAGPDGSVIMHPKQHRLQARAAVRAWMRGVEAREPAWLTLAGPPGVGKTHLGVGVLRYMATGLRKPIRGRYATWTRITSQLRAAMQDRSGTQRIINRLVRQPALVLDEFASGRREPWLQGVLDELVTRRYEERRATLLLTNYLVSEGDSEAHLGGRLGAHSWSRVRSGALVTSAGPDQRAIR